MSDWQCSHCFQIYNFDDFMKLKHEWVKPETEDSRKKYGKRAVCKCGKLFHKDKWQMTTELDGYKISTIHLELGHTANTFTPEDFDKVMWYETMIFPTQEKGRFTNALSFQTRYETKTEAIAGHKLACELLPKILESPDKYPQDIMSVFCQALGNKGSYKPKK